MKSITYNYDYSKQKEFKFALFSDLHADAKHCQKDKLIKNLKWACHGMGAGAKRSRGALEWDLVYSRYDARLYWMGHNPHGRNRSDRLIHLRKQSRADCNRAEKGNTDISMGRTYQRKRN